MKYLKYFENSNNYYRKFDTFNGIKDQDKSSVTDSEINRIQRILGVEYRIHKVGSYNTYISIYKDTNHTCTIFATKDEWFHVILPIGFRSTQIEIYECDQFEGLLHFLNDKIVSSNWYERILKNSNISESSNSEFKNSKISRNKYNQYYLSGLVEPSQNEIDEILTILNKFNIKYELNKKRINIFSQITCSRTTEFNYRIDINKIKDEWFIIRISGVEDWYYKCDTISGLIMLLDNKIPIYKLSKIL